jgi:hypothetical protein
MHKKAFFCAGTPNVVAKVKIVSVLVAYFSYLCSQFFEVSKTKRRNNRRAMRLAD